MGGNSSKPSNIVSPFKGHDSKNDSKQADVKAVVLNRQDQVTFENQMLILPSYLLEEIKEIVINYLLSVFLIKSIRMDIRPNSFFYRNFALHRPKGTEASTRCHFC